MSRRPSLDRMLATGPVRAAMQVVTGGRLRVAAYHGVDDAASFDAQLTFVRRHLEPVGLPEVLAALRGERPLPRGAIWITFDDGEPSVIANGLPACIRHGIRPAMFVCPSVIGTDHPLWWQQVHDEAEIAKLKRMPDHLRRASVARRPALSTRQLTVDELRAFAAVGDVGNHTWDHPLLDRCEPAEQRRQVRDAHEWLATTLGEPPVAFAYPNGNVGSAARLELEALGYQVGLTHDHRLTSLDTDPLALSRLRTSDSQSLARFKAVVTGVHPAVHALRRRAAGLRFDPRPDRS